MGQIPKGKDNTGITRKRIFSVTAVPRKQNKTKKNHLCMKLKTVRLVSFAGTKITGKIDLVLQYIKSDI